MGEVLEILSEMRLSRSFPEKAVHSHNTVSIVFLLGKSMRVAESLRHLSLLKNTQLWALAAPVEEISQALPES